MHAMLLEEYVVLLQKQDEKFILKFHSTSSAVGPLQGETSVNNNKRNTHSPIITLSTTLCRQVATSEYPRLHEPDVEVLPSFLKKKKKIVLFFIKIK